MADITEVDYIWKNGEMIPWAEATTHILSHSLHYGSGVFEGIRCYKNPENGKSYVFRLRDHMERLHRSCKIACIELPYTVDELCDATVELIRKNNLPSCYIRPLVYRGYGVMGVDPTGSPTDVAVAVWPWESYLGADALENGVAVGVSSWRQRSNNAIPPAVKSTASYMNSILAKLEAKEHGYAEAIMLNERASCARAPARTCSSCATACCPRRPCPMACSRASRATRCCAWPMTWRFPPSRRASRAATSTLPTRCS